MSAALSPAVDVLAIQYPGRQDRRTERGVEDIRSLADGVFQALKTLADRPLTFFGHSMGAVVAFEVARRFASEGLVGPARLFVSGRRAPTRHRDEALHLRGDDAIVAEVLSLGGTDLRVLMNEELLSMVLPALRSDYMAVETYRGEPDAVVPCPITALVGDTDPRASIDEVRAWETHTGGGFSLHVLPGGHFYLSSRAAEVLQVLVEHFGDPAAPPVPTGAHK
ncbi:thioesterase II family protein [Streptacidiphilus sp. BW17]|uniref:thioesterase II family protein n=1 Tax=Streptacidiphilus sp. BW17 TaxID=3156274 RepID=UPI003518E0A0